MKSFTYKNKKTGRTVVSDTPLSLKEYVLVTQVRNGRMKSREIIKK